jgi:hypothetical protein
MYEGVDEIGVRGYKLSHIETCKRIWQNHVPESGQSDCIQGELLRQLEGLRNEAQGNGNINWDDNFEYFCDFIGKTLSKSGLFENDKRSKIAGCIGIIKSRGNYAHAYNNGEISDDEVNPMFFAYVDDDLYDYIADAIAVFAESNHDPIPYKGNDSIYR